MLRMRSTGGLFLALTVSVLSVQFVFGQAVSQMGTWMQTIAQNWLVLQITGSGTQLGFMVAAQFLPVLLFCLRLFSSLG